MNPRIFIDFLNTVEKLKCNLRNSWTSSGRRESVAEHSWRLALMAVMCEDEYPELDMNKVIKMCIIHDFGEAVTGDIHSSFKTKEDELAEEKAVKELLSTLPEKECKEFSALFDEMNAMLTKEAKLVKALDKMEVLISHNEAPLSTWLPMEHELNLVYGEAEASFSKWTDELRCEIKKDTEKKLCSDKEDVQ